MLDEHSVYVSDVVRLDLFRSAIEKVLKPGAVVLDLGCGSGVLGLICLQAGASRVIGIDSTAMVEVARESFRRAGLLGQCEFIRGLSYRVEPSMRADIVICDHVGCFGFDYGIIDLLKDARERFLKPGGIAVPSRIRLMLGAVQSEKVRKMVYGWRGEQIPPEYHWLATLGVNTKRLIALSREEILGPPCELGVIDLCTDDPDFLSWTAELVPQRNGVMHGLAGWFECELVEGVWMTNSPLSDEAIARDQAFLPIGEATPVEAGECIKATVMARPSDNMIAWSVELPRSGRSFSHSTWQGDVLGAGDLRRADPNRTPRLSRAGRARAVVLSYCDGRRTAKEIEELVLSEHAGLFPTRSEISRFVGEALARDTD
jgi:protein arginine N-methyltransferase 1